MQANEPTNQRRASVRTNLLSVNASLSSDEVNWHEITANDISATGIGFVSQLDLQPGDKLKLVGEAFDHTHTQDISCETTIIFKASESDGYLYGACFCKMDKKNKTELAVFIDKAITKYPSLFVD